MVRIKIITKNILPMDAIPSNGTLISCTEREVNALHGKKKNHSSALSTGHSYYKEMTLSKFYILIRTKRAETSQSMAERKPKASVAFQRAHMLPSVKLAQSNILPQLKLLRVSTSKPNPANQARDSTKSTATINVSFDELHFLGEKKT